MTKTGNLRRVSKDAAKRFVREPVDTETLAQAAAIVTRVRDGGEPAIREFADRFDEPRQEEPLVVGRAEMRAALDELDVDDRACLERAAERIERFARAQREAIGDVCFDIEGGKAGHTVEPVQSAGCYAPGGRYPLPSSVLMTCVTARVAGCERVVAASPGAGPIMLAAAAIADADEFLLVGGAHAIGALAYGYEGFARCDVIVGPGNRWVTAAKQFVQGVAGIDMLAGPSELLILADETADPQLIAADLLAQAEHDVDAAPILVTTSNALADDVDRDLGAQLQSLATREVAREALGNGFVYVDADIERCLDLVDRIAPEHLEIMTREPEIVAARIRNAGALFIGSRSAEVLGDYGAGPNHTLPTGGTARFRAGLSVMDFLRLRTWLKLDDTKSAQGLFDDALRLAGLEGLAGHAASARLRITK